jgi:hypothetical protein
MRYSPRFLASISSVAILSSIALDLPGKAAFAADNQASTAPRSMPAGLSQITQSNVVRNSVMMP